MAEKIVEHIYKLKGGNQEAIERENVLLERREPLVVFCEDGKTRLKIGDGTHSSNELDYIGANENDLVGKKTSHGGEIFNDYENNKALAPYTSVKGYNNTAGGRAFGVLNVTRDKAFLIDICDITGIEIGDKVSIYSVTTKKVYNDCGTITNIDGNTITIGDLPEDVLSLNNTDITHIYFSNKLELNGDIILGTGASVEGGSVVDDNDGKTYYNKSLGVRSHVEGSGNLSLNYDTHVEGSLNIASGNQAHAGGYRTKSTGYQTFTMGNGTEANGHQALATGSNTKATGQQSASFGSGTEASGNQSDAKGTGSKAIGGQSSAKGYKTEAIGEQSDSSGHSTKAKGGRSHAGGLYSNAEHNQSFVHGTRLKTSKDNQFVVGAYNNNDSSALFIVGNGKPGYGETIWSDDKGERSNAFVVKDNGTAEVIGSDINKPKSVVNSTALKQFYTDNIEPNFIGKKVNTSGVILNSSTNAGADSLGVGYKTDANGQQSFAYGHTCKSSDRSFAGGLYSEAQNGQSFANGTRLKATANNQTVIGKYNATDNDALFIIGNGNPIPGGSVWNDDEGVRSNALMVSSNGLVKTPNAPDPANDYHLTTKKYVDKKVASVVESAPETLNTLNELAKSLGNDPNFATTVATEIGKKVDKVDGKGLSTNDFTDDYKTKLDNVDSEYVKHTDFATSIKAGVVRAKDEYGIRINEDNGNGILIINSANKTDIDNKSDYFKPIVPAYLDYAVKSGLTQNKLTLTAEEQADIKSWLGITDSNNGIITIQTDYSNSINISHHCLLDINKFYNIEAFLHIVYGSGTVVDIATYKMGAQFTYMGNKYVIPIDFNMTDGGLILFAEAKTTDGDDLIDQSGWVTTQKNEYGEPWTEYRYTLVITEA